MNHADRMRRLHQLGYHHAPSVNRPDLTEDAAAALHPQSDAAADMVALYQFNFKHQLDQLSLAVNHRLAKTDGEAGPATDMLLVTPRCGHPDYRADTILEANWPTACRDSLTFGRTFASLPGLSATQTHGVWWAACNNVFHSLDDVAIRSLDVGKLANVTAKMEALQQGVLAWSHLARNSCSVSLDQAYSTRLTWTMRLAIPTATHELLHALGCEHVLDPQATLYAMITDASMARAGWLNQSDLAECQRIGYKPRANAIQPDYDTLIMPRQTDEPPKPPTEPTDTMCPSFDCPLPVMLQWLGMPEAERREAERAWSVFAERMNRGLAAAAEAREVNRA